MTIRHTAQQGLEAARKYSKTAAAVPHALHMPSHIFTRLGYWDESAATNEKAWQTSESDVKLAGESRTLRDFHSLNYLEYAYLPGSNGANSALTLSTSGNTPRGTFNVQIVGISGVTQHSTTVQLTVN